MGSCRYFYYAFQDLFNYDIFLSAFLFKTIFYSKAVIANLMILCVYLVLINYTAVRAAEVCADVDSDLLRKWVDILDFRK